MRRLGISHTLAFIATAVFAAALAQQALALPFSYSSTGRKSVKRSADGLTVTALTQDSEGLVFQDYAFLDQNGGAQYDPRYLAFTTTDSTLDDNYPAPNGQCTGSTIKQVYWVDDYSGGVACVSRKNGVQGAADSYNPRIGGPADEEGRYVIFESQAANLFLPRTPVGGQQVVVHDRRAEDTFLSSAKCVPTITPAPTQNPGSSGNVDLWDITEDGKQMLLTSNGDYMPDNVSPACGTTVYAGPFIRDGGDCVSPSRGNCQTNALYDKYGYHADAVLFLDSDARNGSINTDGSVAAFDSLATVPTRFNPDISGHYDIYMHKSQAFSVISRAQIARCSLAGVLLPLLNTNEPANEDSIRPRLDGSGRYVVFQSLATDLVVDTTNVNMVCKEGNTLYYPHPKDTTYVATGGHTQVYLYDDATKKVSLISKAYGSSAGGNGDSINAWISRDGHYITYESNSTNLLSTATSAHRNIFMYDRVQGKTYLVSTGKVSGQAQDSNGLDADATITHVSKNGLMFAFQTRATNVVDPATNGGANGSAIQHVYIAQNACPLDTDGDGVPDCLDLCPVDLLKTEPGACGCGLVESDADRDLIPDCIDGCANDAAKTSAGQCGCGNADTDTDKDGVADCLDGCPADNTKQSRGVCGCGVVETDTDGDGMPDCQDACPSNPSRKASSGCPCSALKDSPGVCGCNVSDTDGNRNGVADCLDPTANTQPTAPTVDITRTTSDRKKPKYQLVVILQKFSGNVTYNVSVTRGSGTVTKKSTRPLVVFTGLGQETVEVRYSVTVGQGVSAVTSKTTVTKIKLTGGAVTAKAQASTRRGL